MHLVLLSYLGSPLSSSAPFPPPPTTATTSSPKPLTAVKILEKYPKLVTLHKAAMLAVKFTQQAFFEDDLMTNAHQEGTVSVLHYPQRHSVT